MKIEPQTHHVIMSTEVAEVKNGQFAIFQTNTDVEPLDTMAVCDLIKNPNQFTQYQP